MFSRGSRAGFVALAVLATMGLLGDPAGPARAASTRPSTVAGQPVVWATTTPMPEALSGLAAAALGSEIFVTGGTTSSPFAHVSGATWSFSPAAATWTAKASLPSPRTGLALVATGGFLYAVGGTDGSKNLISEVDRYDPGSDSWTAVAALPVPLNQPATTVGKDGRVYVVFIGTNGLQAEVYTPTTDSWSLTTPVAGSLPLPLSAAATGVDGRVYAFSSGDGCCNNGDLGGGGFAFNPVTNTWDALPQLRALPGNVWWGSWADARRDPQGRIVMVGGWGSCAGTCGQPYGSLSFYDPHTRQWSFGVDAPAEAQMPATVMFRSSLYSFGGTLGGPGQATSEVDVLSLADTMAPTVQAPPSMTISPTDPVNTAAVPIHIVAHVTDPSGIAGVHLQQSIKSGSFSDVLYPWSGADPTVQPGTAYAYRQQYVDGVGNLSAWSAGPTFGASIDEESFRSIKYSGTWIRGSSSGALGGFTRSTMSPGASATLAFSGRSVRFVGAATAQSGFAEIVVDGVLQGIYNFAPGASNTVSLTYSWPMSGNHTIEVMDVKGGAGTRVDVDAFLVLS
jgi:hypothetical protein